MFIEDMLKQLASSLLAYKQAQFNETMSIHIQTGYLLHHLIVGFPVSYSKFQNMKIVYNSGEK